VYEIPRKRLEESGTNRLRVRNFVGEESTQQVAVRVNLRFSEVDPLFDKGLFFGGSTQQHGGVWTSTGDH
jgi:hypothetical protein